MFWIFVIVCAALILAFIIEAQIQKARAKLSRWGEVSTNHLIKTDAFHANGNISENAPNTAIELIHIRSYKSKDFASSTTMPVLVVFQHNGRKFSYYEQYAVEYAFAGYFTMLIGYDKAPKQHDLYVNSIVSAFPQIIAYVKDKSNINLTQVCVMGGGWGGEIALQLYAAPEKSPSIAAMVGISLPKISNTDRISHLTASQLKNLFLIHAEDDAIVKLADFQSNIAALKLPKENYIIAPAGGHYFLYNEVFIAGQSFVWLKDIARPTIEQIHKRNLREEGMH